MAALLVLVVSLIVMGYGFAYMFGGSKLAGRFLRTIGRLIGRQVDGIGRWVSRLARRHPRATGIVILIMIVLASGLL